MEQDLHLARAVDPGGLLVVAGKRQQELPQHEGAEGPEGEGQDDRRVGVDEPEGVGPQEQGNDEHLDGQHQGGDEHREQGGAPGELQAREGVGVQHGDHHGDEGPDERVGEGVDQDLPERDGAEGLREVVPAHRVAEQGGPGGQHLVDRFQCGEKHPHEGRDERHGHDHQQRLRDDLPPAAGAVLLRSHSSPTSSGRRTAAP